MLLQTRFSTHAAIADNYMVSEERNVHYGGDNGVDELKLDLQWPNENVPAGGWPALVASHGNGQNKNTLYYFCKRRARAGRLCMAPDRRSNSERQDTELAIEWLFANAAEYDVNVNKVVLYGYSKGGFITNNMIWNDPEIEEQTAAVILASGVGSANVDDAHAEGPPMLLISCEDDTLVRYRQTVAMYDKLVGFGSDVTLWTCHNGHASQGAEGFDEQVDAFLNRVVPVYGELSTPAQGGSCMDWCANQSPSAYCEWDSCSGCDAC